MALINFSEFSNEVVTILWDGGWLMIPLAFIAVFIYFTAFQLYLYFSTHTFWKTPQETWNAWISQPGKAEGELGGIIQYSQEITDSLEDIQNSFLEIRNAYLPKVDRRIGFLFTLVNTAPLTGLLGTVVGMLTTFRGISASAGGQTVDLIAEGISQALITTQTGLMIAIPAYVMIYSIQKRRNQMEKFLVHLETVTIQYFQKSRNIPQQT